MHAEKAKVMTGTPVSIPGRRKFAQAVVAEVARQHRLVVRDLTGPDRFAHFVAARREAARKLRKAGIHLHEIGNALGGRHHTTVWEYFRRDGWAS